MQRKWLFVLLIFASGCGKRAVQPEASDLAVKIDPQFVVGKYGACFLDEQGKPTCKKYKGGEMQVGRTTGRNYREIAISNSGFCGTRFGNSLSAIGIGTKPGAITCTKLDPPEGGDYYNIQAGAYHFCALKNTDSSANMYCWSDSAFSSTIYKKIPEGAKELKDNTFLIPNVPRFSIGYNITCYINYREAIQCFGEDLVNASFFTGGRTLSGILNEIPSGHFKDISVGVHHACSIKNSGKNSGDIVCWGAQNLDDNKLHKNRFTDPRRVSTKHLPQVKYTKVKVSRDYSCATTAEKKWNCWGVKIPKELQNSLGGEKRRETVKKWISPGEISSALSSREEIPNPDKDEGFIQEVLSGNNQIDFLGLSPEGNFCVVLQGKKEATCVGYGYRNPLRISLP